MASTKTKQVPVYINLPAGSDLSTKQSYFMVLASGVLAVAGAGAAIVGVLDDKPNAAGKVGRVQIGGVAVVLAGGTCTRDLAAASDANGKAVNAAGSARQIGIFLDTGSAGDYVRVLMLPVATGQAADVETVTTGALNPEVPETALSVTGTQPYTLAAPTRAGQKKRVVCILAATTPAGTLTVSSPDDTAGFVCPATFFFDAVGQSLDFVATPGLKWRCVAKQRVGFKTLVVGTTVTTGICDMSHIRLSVTGTVASITADKSIPNGAAIGEQLLVGCSVAASTPHGDIGGTFLDTAGAAKTALDDYTAVTDHLLFAWTGAAYQLLSNNSTAVTLTGP